MLTGYNSPEYNPSVLAAQEAPYYQDDPYYYSENDMMAPPLLLGEERPPRRTAAEDEPAQAQAPEGRGYEKPEKALPVDITADSMTHDDRTQTIIAFGNVEIIQGERILRADEVHYNLSTDNVKARGNVVLSEANGDVHFADEVSLSENMRRGFVRELHSYLADGGHFSAEEGERIAGERVVMRHAAYTPCECDVDEDGNPVWQIRADEVTYHESENRVSYKNARFEIFGIPTLWTPYLSHPDGKVKRKSGFLTPEFGYDSRLGAFITPRYYWAIAPDKDATVGLMATSHKYPVLMTEYRQRFEDAELFLDGSLGYVSYTDVVGGVDRKRDEELRGHIFGKGRWDINNKWRAGFDLEKTSDEQYLRQFDISSKDLLKSELFVERFSGRNYATARGMMLDDVRVDVTEDQPDILPEVLLSFYGEPNAMLGGRWSLAASGLGLMRNGSGQDMHRFVVEGGWQRRDIFDFGLVTTTDLLVRGDAYIVNDRDVAEAGSGRSASGTETRGHMRAHIEASYPLVKNNVNSQMVVEPVASLTASPDTNVSDGSIPNEDSQDVQLDASNIFDPDRFPGLDRIEDGSHAAYGVRAGIYGHDGSRINGFVGQSYRFDEDELFPRGSGLSRQESDIVGSVSALYKDRYGLDYRFQMGSVDFSSQRHELDAHGRWDRLSLRARYLFAKTLEGIDSEGSREQIEAGGSLKLTDGWWLNAGALYDLGEDPGLRRAMTGLDYTGCCLSLSVAAERRLTTDSSGDGSTSVTLRLGLKNIGEFQALGSGSTAFGGK